MKRLSILLLVAAGCGGGGGGDDLFDALPGVDPILIVVNEPDDFSLVGTGSISGTEFYDWPCSTPQANLTFAGGMTSGSIRLEVWDDAGVLVHDNVYPGTFAGGIDAVTAPGATPGLWTLRFTFSDALWSGAIELAADEFGDPDEIVVGGGYAFSATWFYQVGWGAGPAQVDVGSGLSAGSFRIRMWDGAGALVYDRTFWVGNPAVSEPTAAGVGGAWTVRIDFTSTANGGGIVLSQ